VLLAVFLLREHVTFRQKVSFLVASIGVFLLSDGIRLVTGEVEFEASSIRLFGNLLLMISMLGEGLYSAGGRLLHQRTARNPSWIFTASLTWGVIFLSVMVIPRFGLPRFESVHLKGVLSLLWMGPIGTSFCYLIWLRLLQGVEVSFLSITLFVQPLAGAILGWYLLQEPLHFWKLLGGGVILLSMAISLMAPRLKAE